MTTCKDTRLFLHVFKPQEDGQIVLPVDSISKKGRLKVKSVKAMKDGRPLKYKVTDGKLVVTLAEVPAEADHVIEVCL